MALYLLARCTLIVLLLLPIGAHAATYYVAASGGSGTCKTSSSAPGSGIAASFGCLSAGDTLYLLGGTYQETLHTFLGTPWPSGSSWGSPITIAAAPGETVTLRNNGDVIDIGNVGYTSGNWTQYIIFDHLIFETSTWTHEAVKLDVGARYIRFQDCTFTGNVSDGATGSGIQWGDDPAHPAMGARFNEVLRSTFSYFPVYAVYVNGPSNIIDGNTMHDIGGYAIHVYHGNGIQDNDDNIVRNNKLYNNGYMQVSTTPTCGIVVASGVNIQAYNNVITTHQAGRPGGGCGLQVYGNTTSAKVYNNTLYANVAECIRIDAGAQGAIIRNNICYNNGSNILNNGSGSDIGNNLLGTNPSFVNLVTGDYHLQSGSAAINYGVTAAGFTTDKDGNSRGSVGASSDAGAYEFVTTAGTSKGTFFVATSGGSDGNSCDDAKGTLGSPSASPKATINAALGCAASESTIYIRTGTYAEQIDTNSQAVPPGTSWSAPTTLAAYPGETVTLTRNTGGVIIFLRNGTSSQYIIFDRLIIDGLNTADTNGLVTYPGVNHIRFQNGEIKRTYYEGAFIYQSDNIEVLDTACHGTTLIDCIGINNSTNITLRGGSSYSNTRDGIAVSATSSNVNIERMAIHDNGANGITTNALTTALIANNLIYDNTVRGIEVQTGSSGVKVYNNTIWSNTGTSLQINSGASGTLHTNNIYYQNGTDTPANSGSGTVGTTNVTANPTFVAPGPTTTFHVSGSNVVGVGTVLAEVTTDYAGTGRTAPYNTIGAYEEGAPPVTPPTNAPVSPYASTNLFIFD